MTIQQKENAQEVLEVQENNSTKDAFKLFIRGNRQMENSKLVDRTELFLLIEAVRERLYNPSNLDMQEPKILLCNKNTNTPK